MAFYHSSMGAMNAARLLKKDVKKTHQFCLISMGKKWGQVRSEYLRGYLNRPHHWHLKSRWRCHALKGSRSMVDGRIFLKKPTRRFKVWSISLDSTSLFCFLERFIHPPLPQSPALPGEITYRWTPSGLSGPHGTQDLKKITEGQSWIYFIRGGTL
jgi:hypothetical protein